MNVRASVLMGATFATGLVAGLFFAYAISVMPALARASDRTYVETMQRINVAILNGWFGAAFGGALVLTGVAVLLHLRGGRSAGLTWTAVALGLYVLMLVVTFTVNVPLNDALAAAGQVDVIDDLAAVRERFESRWVPWNVLRAIATAAAFGCLCRALVLAGESGAG